MSVVSVKARSFILALFIRDDGERFLLGDKGYDFKDSQLHFAANSIENDEVAKQGADGVLVAGQVRRSAVQSFDGYVGDATDYASDIEQMRRDFIEFFAKGHHFRVIYVDVNRNAWQRKGGYLVDAPEVKELYQIHPEYHVALNFEDVNYYSYDENAEGEEILANLLNVPLSGAVEGGLVWDEDGAVSEDAVIETDGDTATASGEFISVADAVEAPLSSFSLKGNTVQSGTPTPSAPVAVQTVTGENTVKISGKNMFDYTGYNQSAQGLTNTLNADGTITTTGVPTGNYVRIVPNLNITDLLEDGATYTVSKTYPANLVAVQVQAGRVGGGTDYYSGTFTVEKSTHTYYRITAQATTMEGWGNEPRTITCGYQLEKGSTATTYEPYQEQSYPISLGSIELCKLGDYQDYIYKSGDDWYLHKEVGKYVYNNDLSGNGVTTTRVDMITPVLPIAPNISTQYTAISNMYRPTPASSTGLSGTTSQSRIRINTSVDYATSYDEVKALAAANNLTIYYALATPVDTEITNEALIEQLEAILAAHTYAGTNNITTVIAAGNAQGELEIGYYTSYTQTVVGGGYVWEEGGSGGPTIAMNGSISAVYPTWTIYGPVTNPTLENLTNGEQIEYVGQVSSEQTLIIDMGEQTASLDGLNVIGNIVGDFIQLEAGANTLLYSAGSEAEPSEIGWSEIVG